MNDDWTDLSKTWAETPTDAPPLDASFVRALIRRDRLARINYQLETSGALAATAVVVWAVIAHDLPWVVALAAGGFALFALIVTVWSRRGDPGLLLDTPEAALRSALAQARIGLRWAWAGLAISGAAVLFLLVMAITSQKAVGLVMIGAVAILAAAPFYLRHAHNCRRRIAAHEAALTALHAPDPVAGGR